MKGVSGEGGATRNLGDAVGKSLWYNGSKKHKKAGKTGVRSEVGRRPVPEDAGARAWPWGCGQAQATEREVKVVFPTALKKNYGKMHKM